MTRRAASQYRDTSRDGCYGNRPPEPPRAGQAELKTPRHWTPEPWRLRCALYAAARRLPRGTGLSFLLDGVERWVKLTGRGRPGPGPGSPESVQWWQDTLAMVDCVGRVADSGTKQLLWPWLNRAGNAAGEGFKPFGG